MSFATGCAQLHETAGWSAYCQSGWLFGRSVEQIPHPGHPSVFGFPRAADCVARRSSELTMAYLQCTTSDLWLVRFMATLRETQRTQLAPAVSIEHDEP